MSATSAIVSETTCERSGCTFNGPNYYFKDGARVCGRCLDIDDDQNMPRLTSEYAWQLLKAMDQ